VLKIDREIMAGISPDSEQPEAMEQKTLLLRRKEQAIE
jgi:hypothetical protein